MRKTRPHRASERGNVFIFILLGIALFAALAFTISRSMRSETTSTMSDRRMELVISDIMDQAQRLQRGVDRVRRNNYSENQIFLNYNFNPYPNANCTENGCDVFHPDGGGVTIPPLVDDVTWTDGTWSFTTAHNIQGVGDTNDDASTSELLALLRFENEDLCIRLNEKLGITAAGAAPPVVDDISGGYNVAFSYTNTLGSGTSAAIAGRMAACVYESTGCTASADNACYAFYQVLLDR